MRSFTFIAFCVALFRVAAFDNSRYDNVAVYWGQNSYGATHSDTANYQKTIGYYCQDDAIDVLPVAFLDVFFGPGGAPSLNLANICSSSGNTTFPGTTLPDCSNLAPDIETCQSRGKVITLSIGGASGAVGFQSDSQAISFAQTIWDLFLGGSSSTRPFGMAVLDGVDLDIEGGSSVGYAAFVNQIRALSSGANKQYYVTAAPQCVYPDAVLGSVLNSADFDAIYVQFYNNPCGLIYFNQAQNWDYGLWDNWARTISPNKNAKVYIGAPASSSAAGSGYVDINTLSNIAVQTRNTFPSFGGVMLWDASQAYANGRYDKAIKDALVAAGGTGFTYPPCSASAFVSGTNYAAGSKVSYGGYIWQAKWFASSPPANDPSGAWSAISACGGPNSQSSTSTTTSSTPTTTTILTTTTSSTSTTTAPSTTSTPGNCAGVAAWSSAVAYTGGQEVTYNGHSYVAKWWTEGDVPGGAAGVWTDLGPCSASNAVAETSPSVAARMITSRFFRFRI